MEEKRIILHSSSLAGNLFALRKFCKAPKLSKNGTWFPESHDMPIEFGLGCDSIPYNIIINRQGKHVVISETPISFNEYPKAIHILLEGNSEVLNRFNNIYTLNQRNTLMRLLKNWVENGYEISCAYEHDSNTISPGFIKEELLLEPLKST